MRPYQIFASLPPDQTLAVFHKLSDDAPQMYKQALFAACAAMSARPVYLQRQPIEKQAQAIRRALSRVAADSVAEEVLAVYFLECRKELLTEWLDVLGIEHDEGTLKEDDPPSPKPAALKKACKAFQSADDDPDRQLLMSAFAAQSAIDWPDLDALLQKEA
jgi:hypothetical protein